MIPVTDAVLLVEDDAILADILARALEAHGHRTIVAESAEDAERLLSSGLRPDLVLLDVNLPGETGWSLVRGALSGAGHPPVVVTTAVNVSPRRLREYEVAGYLPKPFPLETLLSTIERVVTSAQRSTPDGADEFEWKTGRSS